MRFAVMLTLLLGGCSPALLLAPVMMASSERQRDAKFERRQQPSAETRTAQEEQARAADEQRRGTAQAETETWVEKKRIEREEREAREAEATQKALEEHNRQVAAREEAEAALEHAKEEIAANPKATRLARSALLCFWTRVRHAAKAEIATQQRYAREGGGIIDMRAIFTQQEIMRGADDGLKRARKDLGRGGPMSCEDQAVLASLGCFAAARGIGEVADDPELEEACHAIEVGLLVDLMGRIDREELE